MASNPRESYAIPGTIIFDGRQAMRGYALNKMCFSFNSAENREEYLRDEGAYCRKFNLTDEQCRAVEHRSVLELLHAGGNIYYLAKWAGIFGLNVQQIGAQQRGISEEDFKEMLVQAGERGRCRNRRPVASTRWRKSRIHKQRIRPHVSGQDCE